MKKLFLVLAALAFLGFVAFVVMDLDTLSNISLPELPEKICVRGMSMNATTHAVGCASMTIATAALVVGVINMLRDL